MTLDQCKKGQSLVILDVKNPTSKVSRRFLELGLTSGQRVEIVSTSLSKKVFLIEIRGYVFSVRANLLNVVEVKKC